MIKTDAPLFGRLLTAMVTPFNDDLSIDFQAVDRIVEHLLENGTSTIVVSGTTGESPTLEDDEKKELAKRVIKACKGRAKVVFGAGSNSTAKTVKSCKEAEAFGADGLLVVAPYYNKPSQEGIFAHFEAALNATKLPMIAYNIPGRTAVNINAETIIDLASRFSHLHAVKDSTGNIDQATKIASGAHDHFRLYSGDDNLTLPLLSVGACGVVSVASHIVGMPIKIMVDAYFAGEIEEARRLHIRYLPLFHGLFAAPNPTCVKYALSTMGLCKPHLRLPLVGLNKQQKETLESILVSIKGAPVAAGKR